MMTTKKSSSVIKVKYLLSMPMLLLAFVLLAINVNSWAQENNSSSSESATTRKVDRYKMVYLNLDLNESDTLDVESITPTDTLAFNMVEAMPKYKTGNDADIALFIQQNLTYPKSALDNKVSAKMYVHFVVDEIGKVTSVEVIKSIVPLADSRRAENTTALVDMKNEAIRVISLLEFSAGKQNGQNVRVQYVIPVDYKL